MSVFWGPDAATNTRVHIVPHGPTVEHLFEFPFREQTEQFYNAVLEKQQLIVDDYYVVPSPDGNFVEWTAGNETIRFYNNEIHMKTINNYHLSFVDKISDLFSTIYGDNHDWENDGLNGHNPEIEAAEEYMDAHLNEWVVLRTPHAISDVHLHSAWRRDITSNRNTGISEYEYPIHPEHARTMEEDRADVYDDLRHGADELFGEEEATNLRNRLAHGRSRLTRGTNVRDTPTAEFHTVPRNELINNTIRHFRRYDER
jgi:hypothetical protein